MLYKMTFPILQGGRARGSPDNLHEAQQVGFHLPGQLCKGLWLPSATPGGSSEDTRDNNRWQHRPADDKWEEGRRGQRHDRGCEEALPGGIHWEILQRYDIVFV